MIQFFFSHPRDSSFKLIYISLKILNYIHLCKKANSASSTLFFPSHKPRKWSKRITKSTNIKHLHTFPPMRTHWGFSPFSGWSPEKGRRKELFARFLCRREGGTLRDYFSLSFSFRFAFCKKNVHKFSADDWCNVKFGMMDLWKQT